jgi:hypothetical protein
MFRFNYAHKSHRTCLFLPYVFPSQTTIQHHQKVSISRPALSGITKFSGIGPKKFDICLPD